MLCRGFTPPTHPVTKELISVATPGTCSGEKVYLPLQINYFVGVKTPVMKIVASSMLSLTSKTKRQNSNQTFVCNSFLFLKASVAPWQGSISSVTEQCDWIAWQHYEAIRWAHCPKSFPTRTQSSNRYNAIFLCGRLGTLNPTESNQQLTKLISFGSASIGYGNYWLVQYQDNVTEWEIRPWCWWPGFPVGQHYEFLMCSHCHKYVSHYYMTLNVVRMQSPKRQTNK